MNLLMIAVHGAIFGRQHPIRPKKRGATFHPDGFLESVYIVFAHGIMRTQAELPSRPPKLKYAVRNRLFIGNAFSMVASVTSICPAG